MQSNEARNYRELTASIVKMYRTGNAIPLIAGTVGISEPSVTRILENARVLVALPN